MRARCRAAGTLLALAALPLSPAIADAAIAKPAPGALFVGAPARFGRDQLHLRVNATGTTMRLVGSFAWSYGCSVVSNYGIADARTLGHAQGNLVALFAAPTVLIHGNSFQGSAVFMRYGHRYGRFTISGTFTSAHTASASFSFADPPRCGTFTDPFTLRAT